MHRWELPIQGNSSSPGSNWMANGNGCLLDCSIPTVTRQPIRFASTRPWFHNGGLWSRWIHRDRSWSSGNATETAGLIGNCMARGSPPRPNLKDRRFESVKPHRRAKTAQALPAVPAEDTWSHGIPITPFMVSGMRRTVPQRARSCKSSGRTMSSLSFPERPPATGTAFPFAG